MPTDLEAPGFWEDFKETFFGAPRPLDCLQVEVTTRCPGRCGYCPRSARQDRWLERDIDERTFQRLWPLMRRATRVHLQGWGEPLLHPRFFSLTALARKAGCLVSTTTCGLVMDPATAGRLVESGIDVVAFSLAGPDREGNAVRHGVGFDRVCAAITALQALRREAMAVHLEIHIAYLLLASRIEALARLPDLASRLGVHAVVVSVLDSPPAPGFEGEDFTPAEGETLARAGAALATTRDAAQRLGIALHWALPRPEATGTVCHENIGRSLFVAADGSVSPCVFANLPLSGADPRRHVLGDVGRTDPLEIWESEARRSFLSRLAAGDPDPTCRGCPRRFLD
jgi:MoaA/NifB/PqqE/SkfB family radical SAM enzyme